MNLRAVFRRSAFCTGLAITLGVPTGHAESAWTRLDTLEVPIAENPEVRFGRLRPLGMIEIRAQRIDGLSLSQLSGLAWDDDDGILYAISDKGALFHLRPRFKDGRLTGLEGRKGVRLLDPKTGKSLRGAMADSEGLDIANGRNGITGDAELVVSFEHRPRIVRYRPDGTAIANVPLPRTLTRDNLYASGNRMLEAVCIDPELGYLTAPEAPREDEPRGFTRIYDTSGETWLYPPAHKGSHITALECLGHRKVLVLERDFGRLLGRVETTLRLADLASPPGEKPVSVKTVATLRLSDGHLIDNFEGLAHHRGNRFFMVSDDNDMFFQRTLLLYFELDLSP